MWKYLLWLANWKIGEFSLLAIARGNFYTKSKIDSQ